LKNQIKKAYKDWDRVRNNATGPSELREIDAIFTRELSRMETAED